MESLTRDKLDAHLAKLIANFSVLDKDRWCNGQCHSFALALGLYIEKNFAVSQNNLRIVVGERYGRDPYTRRMRKHFTHAALQINFDNEKPIIADCLYEMGYHALLLWESQWFFDDLNNPNVFKGMTELFWNWSYPDETQSSFSWNRLPFNARAVAKAVYQIDRSHAPSKNEIAYALHQIKIASHEMKMTVQATQTGRTNSLDQEICFQNETITLY
jgi:hypothetical protein